MRRFIQSPLVIAIAGHALTGIALGLGVLMFWIHTPGHGLALKLMAFPLIPLIVLLMPEHRPLWRELWAWCHPSTGARLAGGNARLRRRRRRATPQHLPE